jgi:hypothetical protein
MSVFPSVQVLAGCVQQEALAEDDMAELREK